MNASPKKMVVAKFGVTLVPSKKYYCEGDEEKGYRLQVAASVWVGGFKKKDLTFHG